MTSLMQLTRPVRNYLVITLNYWMFTVTDGALRMLIVLHFHGLGYSTLAIASLFLFYEAFGIVTNAVGGWLGSRIGLNRTMQTGMALQLIALSMLLLPTVIGSIAWVMAAQALSGIAKDLNKMSAKSAIKTLVPADAPGRLFKWVAVLTGSKNTLKGVGFFVGAVLLAALGFEKTIAVLCALILVALVVTWILLDNNIGVAKKAAKFTSLFSRSAAINRLSLARVFLFASRDVWFVVALPVYLSSVLKWSHWQTGAFMACWIIGYGVVQAFAPQIAGKTPTGRTAAHWATALCALLLVFAGVATLALPGSVNAAVTLSVLSPATTLIIGLFGFGMVFAVNSSIHSFLIVHYANRDATSVDVGFYYMANAAGRLIGTVLSGWIYLIGGLLPCLYTACALTAMAAISSYFLPSTEQGSDAVVA